VHTVRPVSDAEAYAESLYVYASARLDAYSLRCWIVQRLMLDLGLDHAQAVTALEAMVRPTPPRRHPPRRCRRWPATLVAHAACHRPRADAVSDGPDPRPR
jgi:hypothetical protein